jgi:dUTP pyrophosphatase
MSLMVPVLRFAHARDLPLPAYATAGAAGLDLVAAVPADAPLEIRPLGRVSVPTGLALAIPDGHEGQIRPRSGLALRRGITVLNAPGTIDADYRGEIGVILVNLGDTSFVVRRGDRIAQLVIAPVVRAALAEAAALAPTLRDTGGFGSTGTGSAEAEASGTSPDRTSP